MQPDDVVLSWSRGNAGGDIDSPFALSSVLLEESEWGIIVLKGRRGSEERSWSLQDRYWGTLTRPNFCGTTLAQYLDVAKVIGAGKALEASKLLDAMAASSETKEPTWLRSWLQFRAASILAEAHQWKESDYRYQRATVLANNDPIVSAQLFHSWGTNYLQRSEWYNAEKCFRETVAISEKSGQTYQMSNGLSGLLWTHHGHGEIIQAEDMARRLVALWEKIAPTGLTVGTAYLNLGAMLTDRGNFALAEEYFHKALTSYQTQAPGSTGLAYILDDLGEVERERGNIAGAQDYFQQSFNILGKVDPDDRATASVLTNLAGTAEITGAGRPPEDYLQDALAIMHKVSPDGSQEEADIQNTLGKLAIGHSQYQSAEQAFHRALALNEKLAPEGIMAAETLDHLADLSLLQGYLDHAEEFYLRAEKIQNLLVPGTLRHAESLIGLASVYQKKHQLDKAAAYYERANATLESQTAHLGGSGDIRAGFRAKHQKYYRDYVDFLTAQGKNVRALEMSEGSRARTLIEILASTSLDTSKGADAALVERESSLAALVKAKSQHRIDLLGGPHSDEQIKEVEKQISRLTTDYQNVEDQIRSSSPGYAALTQPQPLSAKAIQEQLLDKDTILLEYSLGEERSHVFAVTPDSLQAFELPKRADIEGQSRMVYQLLTERNRTVQGESEAQRDKRWAEGAKAYDIASAELSRMVLGPVAAQMPIKNKRLVIVADGALHYVPFAALPELQATAESGIAGQPLTVNHEIVSLPSASVLALLRQQYKDRKPAPNAVAVLADPVFNRNDPRVSATAVPEKPEAVVRAGTSSEAKSLSTSKATDVRPGKVGSNAPPPNSSLSKSLLTRSAGDLGFNRDGQLSLPRLRYTREEADAIYAVAPRSKALEATDFKATRAAAISPELANYRIVHFATHGLLNSQHPELSGLVFSLVDKNGKAQDGFLSLQDIYNLNLPADLVVLSACETGLGKEISGEGLIGLTRGFMYAGATRVVASLWNVSDVATARLMAEFYRSMEKDGLAPAAALRSAQIKMLQQKRWASPYYWAAFQIQGEWK